MQEIAYARLRVDVETLDLQKQCLINDYNILADRWLDGEYKAKVTAYTLFGIPIGTARVDCYKTR